MNPPDGPVRELPYPRDMPYPELPLAPRLERLRYDFAVQYVDEGIDTTRYAFWFAWLAQELAAAFDAVMDSFNSVAEKHQALSDNARLGIPVLLQPSEN